MNSKPKKIIAREGLIILSMIPFFFAGLLLPGDYGLPLIYFSMCGYPIYLLIRFIIWAVNTLREK